MDGKTIGALIVGVILGVVVGFFVWGSTTDDTRGEWPDVPCPSGAQTTANDLLDQITQRAMAVNPPTATSQACAVMAQQKKMAMPADTAAACAQVEQALAAAGSANWAQCKDFLDELE